MKHRKDAGESVDSSDVKKHKKDILRIATELLLEATKDLPQSVDKDIRSFIDSLEQDPFDSNSLKQYGLKNQDVIEVLRRVYI